ncbi:MAG: class I SAM-dependent methyltransferase [Acidiferrobacterales bacterium]
MSNESVPSRSTREQAADLSVRLPTPTAAERARSDKLVRHISDEIERAGGSVDFTRYMELALYAPDLGYYRSGAQKFGARGDFVTAPDLSPLFAYCVAKQCQQILMHLGAGDILEAGAGNGALAAALLHELDTLECLPDNYFILELSGELQQRQAALIKQRVPHLLPRVYWLQALPDDGMRGVVVGNELLDAMPVHRFGVGEHGIQQLYVTLQNGRFAWDPRPANEEIRQRIEPLELPRDYTSEINFYAEAWVRSIAECLQAGVLLLFDYGFPRAEFYHPQRNQGTLMCHYRHRNHDDPLILVGLQDITAHVDFTAIAEAGQSSGLSFLGYTSQAAFLLSSGLDELVAASDPNARRQHLELAQQVNKLTSPAEMGELYKVIALGRGVDIDLQGFALHDRRGRL